MNPDKNQNLDDKKSYIVNYFNKSIVRLGLMGIVNFAGYYSRHDNSRAEASGSNIKFNLHNLESMDNFEIERVIDHELQHINFRQNANEGETYISIGNELASLFYRMKDHFDRHRLKNYAFAKVFPSHQPTNEIELIAARISYFDLDEVLALLSGYRTYLRQVNAGETVKTQPYEFMEAFKETDLQLLDSNYRSGIIDRSMPKNKLPPEPRISIRTTRK